MAHDSIIVMDDARRMVGDILETYSHGGATFAKVRTGPGQTGFVELPDNPETPSYLLYCHECGHLEEQEDGSTETVGEKETDLHGHHKVYQGFQQAFAALAEMDVDDDAEPDIGIAMSDLMDIAATGMKRTAEDAGERVEFSDPPQF